MPNAPRSTIVGWAGDVLKVKLKAPPVEGKANAELCRFLAEALNVHRNDVVVVRGETSRSKWVQVRGWTQPALRERLSGSA